MNSFFHDSGECVSQNGNQSVEHDNLREESGRQEKNPHKNLRWLFQELWVINESKHFKFSKTKEPLDVECIQKWVLILEPFGVEVFVFLFIELVMLEAVFVDYKYGDRKSEKYYQQYEQEIDDVQKGLDQKRHVEWSSLEQQ